MGACVSLKMEGMHPFSDSSVNRQFRIVFGKTGLPDQISTAGTALLRLQAAPIPATGREVRAVNTTGVCRQHNMCWASARLQGRPFQSCRYHIIARC